MKDDSILPIEASSSVPHHRKSDSTHSNQDACSLVSHQSLVSVQLDRCKNLLAKLQNEFSEEDDENYWAERLRVFRARTESGLRKAEEESREEPVRTDDAPNSEGRLEGRDDGMKDVASTLDKTMERDRNNTIRASMQVEDEDTLDISYHLSASSKRDSSFVNQLGQLDVTETDTTPHLHGSKTETDATEQPDDSRGAVQEAVTRSTIDANKSDSKKRKIVKLLLKSLKSMRRDSKQPSHGECVMEARGAEQNDDVILGNGVQGSKTGLKGQESRDDENLSKVEPPLLIAEDAAKRHHTSVDDLPGRQPAESSEDISRNHHRGMDSFRQKYDPQRDQAEGDEEKAHVNYQHQHQLQQQLKDELASREQAIVIEFGDQGGDKHAETLEETTKQIHQQFELLRNVFGKWRSYDGEATSETKMGVFGKWRSYDGEAVSETKMGTLDIHELVKADGAKMDPVPQATAIDNEELGQHVGNAAAECAKSLNGIGRMHSNSNSDFHEKQGAVSNKSPPPCPETLFREGFSSKPDKNHVNKMNPPQHSNGNVTGKTPHSAISLEDDKSVLSTSSRNQQGKLAETAPGKREAQDIQDLDEKVSERKKHNLIDLSRLKRPTKKHHVPESQRSHAESMAAEDFSASEVRKAECVEEKTFGGKKNGHARKGQHHKASKSKMVKGLDLAICSITRPPNQDIVENSSKHVVVKEPPAIVQESLRQTSACDKPATVRVNPEEKDEESKRVMDTREAKNKSKNDKKARKKEKGTGIKLIKQQSQNSDTENLAAEKTARLSASKSRNEDFQGVVKLVFTGMGKQSKALKPTAEDLELEIRRIPQPTNKCDVEPSSSFKVVEESPVVKPLSQIRVLEDPKAQDEELDQFTNPVEVKEKSKKDKKSKKEKKIRKELKRQEKKERRVKLRNKVGNTWAMDDSKRATDGLVDNNERLFNSSTELVINKDENSLDDVFCSEVSKHDGADCTESDKANSANSASMPDEKVFSLSDEFHARDAPPILPPSDVQEVIWWSTSKDAVEILYEEEDEISSESDSLSSSASTNTSDDDSSIQTIDFSFETLRDVTDALVEEAAIIKQDFVNEVRRKASDLIRSWIPQKTKDRRRGRKHR